METNRIQRQRRQTFVRLAVVTVAGTLMLAIGAGGAQAASQRQVGSRGSSALVRSTHEATLSGSPEEVQPKCFAVARRSR
jgi:hypothetical protein